VTDEPRLITGDSAIDDRGEVSFVNDFSFAKVKRFYMVRNHRAGFVRAWHGHKREGKYVLPVTGASLVAAVAVDDWENPSAGLKVHRFVLDAAKPRVLYVPPGYANGLMSLTADARLMFFSTSTLEESKGDDIRFPSRYWDVWSVEER
jgi:dTDP-4-dehydrorhamnose 3,5-epimerase-like enzyme